jgi:hypothetical protein
MRRRKERKGKGGAGMEAEGRGNSSEVGGSFTCLLSFFLQPILPDRAFLKWSATESAHVVNSSCILISTHYSTTTETIVDLRGTLTTYKTQQLNTH